VTGIVTVLACTYTETYDDWQESLIKGLFQAVSIGTTTGFTTAEFYYWPAFIAILLLFLQFCRRLRRVDRRRHQGHPGLLLLVKQGLREITRLVHPNAKMPVRIGDKTVDSRVVEAVWGFFALYVASFTVMYLALASTGLDLMTAFSAVAASINNLGPGLGGVGAHYADMHDLGKWILCFAMLLGRFEIFTLLVLLTPAFWRK
jgi:trk system potassium uptake protein TrkH